MLKLQDREWKEFKIGELFEIRNGKRLEKENQVSGKRPFIGSSDANNGITNFVDNDNISNDRNCIGINYNGSVGEAFYHPYECIFSDDVKHLHLKMVNDSKYVCLFMCAVIKKQKDKFQYGYKMNSARMSRQIIKIPINEKQEPDYEFMSSYARERETLITSRYENYLISRK